ncbi:transcriptional regulator GutM [Enemella sp. A6]|uniref:transcriptional regulator GutM n=1 Tax=Enemella sp. A6 TaxID=3440152 RepID=UPI003EBB7954
MGGNWVFPAILGAALLIGVAMTFLQQCAYNKHLNEAMAQSRGAHDVLASGQGRSPLGGAVVILIVDAATREITWATAMVGATVFSRFRPRPQLLGPVDTAADRVNGKQFKHAVEMAVAQVKPAVARADTPRRTKTSVRAEQSS